MPAITATAPGKIILLGEHAVVYGQPAIAVPLTQLRARAAVTADPRAPSGQVLLDAPSVGISAELASLPADQPLAAAIRLLLAHLRLNRIPACTIRITSTIPVSAGLGSGAAVTVALLRALSTFLGQKLTPETLNTLAYEIEKLHHGTPSGIDNTVITYATPVYFVRGQSLETFTVKTPLHLLIADTGAPASTAKAVADVRQGWQADPEGFEQRFAEIGALVVQARRLIENGQPGQLGELMDRNHALLRELGVSSPALDQLTAAARLAGAWGAKLSGGGQGGNLICLVPPDLQEAISATLLQAGAVRTYQTILK